MQKDNGKYKVIATKVAPEAYETLQRIASARGMAVYELLQLCADTLVRYCSDEHNLTAEMERAMGIFEGLQGWAGALNLADPAARGEVREATYYLSQPGKTGTRAVHVESPFFGDWHQTENVQVTLERTLELLLPFLYRRLRVLAVEEGCNSLLDLLETWVTRASTDADAAAIRAGFEDNARAENNKPIEYGTHKRARPNYNPDHQPPWASSPTYPHGFTFDPDDPLGYSG